MTVDLTLWQTLALLAKVTVYAGSALAMGTVLFHRLVDRNSPWRDRNMVLICAAIALLAGGAQMLIQSGRLMDDGMAGAMDTEMWALVASTPLGTSIGVRTVGLILIVVGAIRFASLWPVALLGIGITAFSFPLVGHATDDTSYLLTLLICVHVLVMAFWIGGLMPLHRAAGTHTPAEAGKLAHAFGNQATVAVAALVGTGGWVALTLVGSLENLITTAYGLTLLAKLALVSVLLGLAALNKLRLVPNLSNGSTSAALALQRSIRLEGIAFALIFIATAVLTTILSLPSASAEM